MRLEKKRSYVNRFIYSIASHIEKILMIAGEEPTPESRAILMVRRTYHEKLV